MNDQSWSPRHRSRIRVTAVLVTVAAAALLLLSGCGSSSSNASAAGGGSGGSSGSSSAGLGTLHKGELSVAIESYMPYTGLQGGKIIGLDGDIINAVAKNLHLTVKPVMTDFTGMLGDVQSHRVDITVGGVAWSAEREQAGLFTDPPYYSPPAMGVQSGHSYKTVTDLQGLNIGTVTGYVWVNSIKSIPRATLHAYPNANDVFADLSAGRINVAFLDPLLIIYYQKQRPDQHVQSEYLTPPTAAQVKQTPGYQYLRPYMTGFYLPKQEPKLAAAVSAQMRKMYADGEMSALIKKWGGDPSQFLKPASWMAAERRGVDRPASWTPPSIG
jgi:ABC-type amino acid transport substrate-binding protein